MRISETIPTILTWAEIKAHCRLDDDTEQSYLEGLALSCVEAFEKETNVAAKSRTLTVVYSVDDLKGDNNTLVIPKGPVASITSIANASTTLNASTYELRKQGHIWYVHLTQSLATPITLTASIGPASAPSIIKQAVLIHLDHLRLNRAATSAQQKSVVELGLTRIYELYGSCKYLVG